MLLRQRFEILLRAGFTRENGLCTGSPHPKKTHNAALEKRLWEAADQFRANSGLKSQEYSAPVLGLIATEVQDFWPRRGAAQPFISRRDTERTDILTPDRATMKRFPAFAAASLERIALLQVQIQNLRRTRDLLLPRLLSGQVELETEEVRA